MSDATIEFSMTGVPDDAPPTVDSPDTNAGPFIDLYPDSTPEAPYGRKADGTPFKRHHGGGRKARDGSKGQGRMPAGVQAEMAATLLARLNSFIGIAFNVAGMPESAKALAANNEQFRVMAQESLEADPALCKKILSAGATGGKAGLIMAYAMLGASTFPALRDEYKANHPKEIPSDEETLWSA